MRPLQRWKTRSRLGPTIDSRGREPGPVGVGGVAAQQQQALAAELRQARHVGRRAADGRLVELVVAGEQHGPELGRQRHAAGVGDRVGQVDHLDLERARVDHVAGRQHVEPRLLELVLVELGARHRDRQLAAVGDRDARLPQLAQQPRQRAEVVLVAVRDHDRLDVVDALAQVGEVGQHEVDAQLLGGREAQPRVDHHDAPVVLDDGHVLPDLAHASEREDAQGAAHAARHRREQPVALEHRAHGGGLGLVGLDHREAQRAGVVAEQVQRRLDRGRAGGDEERLVDVAQRRVDLRPRGGLVVHAAHLGPDDVRGDADAAGAAHVQAGARRCRRCRRAPRARRSAAARRSSPA